MTEDIINPFRVGDWVRWTCFHTIKQGRVAEVEGPSLVVVWLDGQKQVFPVVEGYVNAGAHHRIEVIPRPPRAFSIERDAKQGRMSVQRAASVLGTTPKRVRAMLRAGQLEGSRNGDGKWDKVVLNGS